MAICNTCLGCEDNHQKSDVAMLFLDYSDPDYNETLLFSKLILGLGR